MKITVDERFRPFSHLPGTSTILVGSHYQIQIYPCLIRIFDLSQSIPKFITELKLQLKGPIEEFTIFNDLEKGRITITGHTQDGWICYHLVSSQQSNDIQLVVDRAPHSGFLVHHNQEQHLLLAKQKLNILQKTQSFESYQIPSCDRLFLGSHKAQDWEMVLRRLNLAEILPVWHRLGQLVTKFTQKENSEFTKFFQTNLMEEKPEKAQKTWDNLIRVSFCGLLSPRLQDDDYQGISQFDIVNSLEVSPLILLSEGSRWIRQLFFRQDVNSLSFLPHLLPCLPSGRLINVKLLEGGYLSLEWTKKTIRRVVIYVEKDQEFDLKFRSNVSSFRLRQKMTDKGERKNCRSTLNLQKNCHYFFDNFS